MSLALEYQANDPRHYYMYTDEIFQTQFVSSEVSDFDCFHPSADGQRELAAATWEERPFSVPEPSGALALSSDWPTTGGDDDATARVRVPCARLARRRDPKACRPPMPRNPFR
jgi:hypothetical protein